jgi:hypothetical protein
MVSVDISYLGWELENNSLVWREQMIFNLHIKYLKLQTNMKIVWYVACYYNIYKILMLFNDVPLIYVIGIMVFNATFSNFSLISWRVVLLVGEIGLPRENYQLAASHWQTLSYNVL